MEYAQIKNLKGQVDKTLRDYPVTRNSDITLMLFIWKLYYPQLLIDDGKSVNLKEIYRLPREDNIKRVRAKIQNEEKKYWPTDEKVAQARGINAEEWKVAMGYANSSGTFTPPSKQYPEWQFRSDTTSLIYTVKDLGTVIICDCPGFQYRQSCKHVDEVKGRKQLTMELE